MGSGKGRREWQAGRAHEQGSKPEGASRSLIQSLKMCRQIVSVKYKTISMFEHGVLPTSQGVAHYSGKFSTVVLTF